MSETPKDRARADELRFDRDRIQMELTSEIRRINKAYDDLVANKEIIRAERDELRALIVAMLNPTEEMLAKADSAIPRAEIDEDGFRMMGREVALEAWRAMISEALRTNPVTGQAVHNG